MNAYHSVFKGAIRIELDTDKDGLVAYQTLNVQDAVYLRDRITELLNDKAKSGEITYKEIEPCA